MRSSRFLLLALAAVALAGCMQTGGSGPFARNAPPLWQQDIELPAMLRPAPVRNAQAVVVAQPGRRRPPRVRNARGFVGAQPGAVAQPLGEPMAPQPIMPQAVAMGPEE